MKNITHLIQFHVRGYRKCNWDSRWWLKLRAFSWFLVHPMLKSRRTWGFTYRTASWGFLHLLDVHLHTMTGQEKTSVKWCEWLPQASQSYLHLSLCKHVFLVLRRLLTRYSDSCPLALRLGQTCCPADTKIHILMFALFLKCDVKKKEKSLYEGTIWDRTVLISTPIG